MSVAEADARLCRLDEAAGWLRTCPGKRCAFWEPSGAGLEGRCVFHGVDFSKERPLAASLRGVRELLETERLENGLAY